MSENDIQELDTKIENLKKLINDSNRIPDNIKETINIFFDYIFTKLLDIKQDEDELRRYAKDIKNIFELLKKNEYIDVYTSILFVTVEKHDEVLEPLNNLRKKYNHLYTFKEKVKVDNNIYLLLFVGNTISFKYFKKSLEEFLSYLYNRLENIKVFSEDDTIKDTIKELLKYSEIIYNIVSNIDKNQTTNKFSIDNYYIQHMKKLIKHSKNLDLILESAKKEQNLDLNSTIKIIRKLREEYRAINDMVVNTIMNLVPDLDDNIKDIEELSKYRKIINNALANIIIKYIQSIALNYIEDETQNLGLFTEIALFNIITELSGYYKIISIIENKIEKYMNDIREIIGSDYRFDFGHRLFDTLTDINSLLEYIEEKQTKKDYYMIKGAIESLTTYRRDLINLKNIIERKLGSYDPENTINLTDTLNNILNNIMKGQSPNPDNIIDMIEKGLGYTQIRIIDTVVNILDKIDKYLNNSLRYFF